MADNQPTSKKRKALITGITGQDGAYLAKHLLDMDYDVVGLHRRVSNPSFRKLNSIGVETGRIETDVFDLCEPFSMQRMIEKHQPDEIYNLAAMSFVGSSFDTPLYTMEANATGVYRWMDAILNTDRKIRFYQAGTSEMFGMVQTNPQNEQTPFYPRSPYGVAKLSAHWFVKNYRESYNLFACNGILFNHESPLRGTEFVTKKITSGFARIRNGSDETVRLGNINAVRDWGHAADYVKAMHLMMQQAAPDDYVISSGEVHSVREFCEIAAEFTGFNLKWENEGIDEIGIDLKSGKVLVTIDQRYMRPADVEYLRGDCSKAESKLGWKREYSFTDLVKEMVLHDITHVNLA
jgi:GDPmannose 4,6-dehydratase